jgi:gliding motility-associated-like protein
MKAIVTSVRIFALLILQAWSLQALGQVTAEFSTTGNRKGCSPLVVNFTNQSVGATTYLWRFGNGNQSTLDNPSVIYATPGKYTVSLIAINNGVADTIVKTDYIEVFQDPTVDFTAPVTAGCAPTTINFQDLSTPGSAPIRAWIWNFGNGASSSQRNPAYTYTQGGNFNVTLLVVDQNGCNSEKAIANYITIQNKPNAQFIAQNRSSCTAPFTVNFTNQTTPATGLTYEWTLGNGQTSAAQNPSATYNALGSYTVKLKATNSLGCTDSIVKPQYVVIQDLVAQFTANQTTGCAPFVVNFTDQSTANPNSVRWDFGDGTSSTLRNPQKTYTTPGTYTVKLVAANSSSCRDSIIKTGFITVNPAPVADFTSTNVTGCQIPFVAGFSDNSTNAVSWLWTFGNNTSSGQQNPVTVYNTFGNFNVSLTVTNAQGCSNTITRNNYVRVTKPVANFTADTTRGCFPLNTTFTSTITANEPIISYLWDFGDGNASTLANPTHSYTDEGVFDVSLIITTVSGCKDTITRSEFIRAGSKPTVDFVGGPQVVCLFAPVNFTNNTDISDQWFWQFGDGGISTEMSPMYTYGDTGLFTVSLIAWNKGCADTLELADYIYVSPPDARFNIVRDCANPYTVTLVDTSLAPDTWFWDFGDGNTSTDQNPVHTYAAKGNYTISLTVTNLATGCIDIESRSVLVVDGVADFAAAPLSGCHPLTVSTIDASVDANTYLWTSGGMTSTQQSPNFTYNTPGIYDMKLVVSDMLGCTDSLTIDDYITVLGPIANFGGTPRNGCAPLAVSFTDSSTTFLSDIVSWSWSFGNGQTDTAQNPSTLFETPGNYTVALTVVDTNGCSNTKSVTDFIKPTFPTPVFSGDTLSCSSRNIAFQNNSVGTGLTYLWNFGDGRTSTQAAPTHAYAAEGIYTVSLKVMDINGCDSTVTKVNYVTVSDPVADFWADSTFSPCPPLLVDFINLSSSNIVSYEWNFGDGNFSSLASPANVYLTPGNFDVQMIGTTALGCKDTVIKRDFVVVLGPDGTFSFDPSNSCLGFNINFYAQTTNTQTIAWDYGDGNVNVNSDDTIAYVYQQAGVYYPTIILDDGLGCVRAITSNDSIVIGEINANFANNINYICKQGTVQFADISTGIPAINNWNWSFGDGTTSTLQNPQHTYTTEGFYDVKLIVKSDLCNDTIVKTNAVYVDPGPTTAFEPSALKGCDSLMISLTDQSFSDSSIISWNWTLGNGLTSTTQNPTVFYNTTGAFNIQLIVAESTGCTDTLSKTINVYSSPIIIASNDTVICENESVQLNVSGIGLAYIWSPANGLSDSNIANPITTPASSTNYMVTATDTNGCSAIDMVRIIVNPIPVGSVSEDKHICIGNGVELNAFGGTNYLWSPNDGSLSTITQASVIASPTADTEYSVRIGNMHNCYDYDTVTVFVHQYPLGIVAETDSVCYGLSTDIYTEGGNQFTWSPSEGLSCTDCETTTATPLATTTYQLHIANEFGCVTHDSILIFVKPNAEALISGAEDICIGASTTLTASGGNNYQWVLPTDIACATCAVQTVAPQENTDFEVIVNNEFNCPINAVFTINVQPLPTVSTIDDIKLCNGDEIQLNTTIVGASNTSWTPIAGLSSNLALSPIAKPTVTTNYVVEATSPYGCTASDSVLITVIEKVNTIVDGDLEICIGESTQLVTSIIEEGYNGTNIIWSPVNNLDNNNSLTPTVNPEVTTTYTMIATSGSCAPDTQTITIVVHNLPSVQIIRDRKVSIGTNINLSVESNAPIESYVWTPDNLLDCNNCETVRFMANTSQTVGVTVTDIYGCTNTDEAQIDVLGKCGSDVFVPNTFTPNGDEMNDKLYVRNLTLDGLKVFRIFDRWGKLVFETTNINDGWDGRYNGKVLNTGVFAYYVEVICSNGQTTPIVGNVTLMR